MSITLYLCRQAWVIQLARSTNTDSSTSSPERSTSHQRESATLVLVSLCRVSFLDAPHAQAPPEVDILLRASHVDNYHHITCNLHNDDVAPTVGTTAVSLLQARQSMVASAHEHTHRNGLVKTSCRLWRWLSKRPTLRCSYF